MEQAIDHRRSWLWRLRGRRALLSSLQNVRYIGCDIVPEIVAHNNRAYGRRDVLFEALDIVSQPLPEGDICLVRQVLQHLPNRDISVLLPKLGKYKYVYVTEAQPIEPSGPANPDMPVGAGVRFDWRTGRGRGVELNLPPWNLGVEVACRAPASPPGKEIITTYRLENPGSQTAKRRRLSLASQATGETSRWTGSS